MQSIAHVHGSIYFKNMIKTIRFNTFNWPSKNQHYLRFLIACNARVYAIEVMGRADSINGDEIAR